MRRSTIAFSLSASLLLAAEGQAQTRGEVRIYEENDFFNPFTEQTDRYYTQGLRVEWLAPEQRSDARFLPAISHADWCSLVCGEGFREGHVNTGFAVGQNIYTPANIRIAARQPYDRPWAGVLYGSRIARINYAEPALKAQRQDRIELSLGIVGPAALAKETQTGWHKLIGAPRPEGWAHQLGTEPVVQLRYDAALRWPRTDGGKADVISRGRINLGNGLTSLEAELTGRLGWNLSGFGAPSIPLAAPPPVASTPSAHANALAGTRWLGSGNLFLRLGGKAVVRNLFLDGNSFASNDIRIDRTLLVPEIGAGMEFNLVGDFWLTAQWIHRGSEFKSRGRAAPAQAFGSITLAWTIGS